MPHAQADVVTLIGNPRSGSRTRALADATTSAVIGALATAGVPLTGGPTLELADVVAVSSGGTVSFGPDPAQPVTIVDSPHDTVRQARLLVVATPTYKGSYTGLLKLFLDQYRHRALAGVVAVPVGIAAAEAHRQSVAAALEALLLELGATVPAPTLAVLESALGDPDQLAADWAAQHASALVKAVAAASDTPIG